MIVKGIQDTNQYGRTFYPLNDFSCEVKHFVIRVTTPDNPFVPHKHEQKEMWFVIEGKGLFAQDGKEKEVQEGDLILIESWMEHGLKTETKITWICLG